MHFFRKKKIPFRELCLGHHSSHLQQSSN